jgi:NitT/TauT family transport system substrate-binding protein
LQLGVLAFREVEMRRQARTKQLELFTQAYNQACDSINKYGVAYYRSILVDRYKVKGQLIDSIPHHIRFMQARGPRQKDINYATQWLEKTDVRLSSKTEVGNGRK